MHAPTDEQPLESGTKVGLDPFVMVYTLAHFGKSLLWYASESLFAFLLTEVLQLSPALVGMVLGVSFLISAMVDLVLGVGLQSLLTTKQSAGQVQFGGALASALALVLLFAVPAAGFLHHLWLPSALVMLFRVAYGFVDLPQNALLSSAVRDGSAPTSLASGRLAASGLAAMTIAATVSAIVYNPTHTRAAILLAVAAGMSALTIATSWLLCRATRRNSVALSHLPGADARKARLPQGARLLLPVMMLTSLAGPVFTKLVPYYAAFQLSDPVTGAGAITMLSLGMVVGQPVWLWCLRGRPAGMRLAVTALSTSASAALFGLIGPVSGPWLMALALVFGISSGGLGMVFWAAFGEVIAREGAGQEGRAYGLLTACAKLSLAFSAIGIGWLLSTGAFRAHDSLIVLAGMTIPSVVAGLTIVVLVMRWPAPRPV